ncbi:cold-shock DNA-binding domain protein [Candidatus Paraburkholderia kirkii]|nr:cold-shock DNA-binding domain protein [Candidatus Paraburkholderia kirkii]
MGPKGKQASNIKPA